MSTIPPNNTSGLYGIDGTNITVDNNVTANNISATGNVTVDGYIISDGSITTNSNFVGDLIGNVTGNVTGNVILSGGNTEIIYNNNGVTGSSPAFTFDSDSNLVTVGGNVTADYYIGDGSLLTGITADYGNSNVVTLLADFGANTVSTTGNISGGYFLGDGSQLTGLPATYGNSNVVTLMASFGSNTVSTTGNISGGYILGDGSQLTGLPATYGNANVEAYLPTYSGNLNPDTISATGNITGLNLKTSGAFGNITGANYVSAGYFVGDGSLLTNLPTSNVSLSGNLAGNLQGNGFGANAFSFVSATGNVDSGNINTGGVYASGVVSATGNVRGGNINTAGLVTATGNITGGNITTAGDVSAVGKVYGNELYSTNSIGDEGGQLNLAVPLTTTTLQNSVTVDVYQNKLRFFENSANALGAYLDLSQCASSVGTNLLANVSTPGGSNTYVQFNDNNTFGGNAQFVYNKVTNSLEVGNVKTDSNGFGTNFQVGDDAWLGDINVSDTVGLKGQQSNGANGYLVFGNANGAALGRAGTGPLTYGGAFSASGNITGNYILGDGSQLTNLPTGNYSNANVAAYLPTYTGDLQAGNVTVLGRTFVGSGNVAAPGISFASDVIQDTGFYLISDGNIGVATNGTQRAIFDNNGNFSAIGNISGSYILGNGSQLTGLPATYSDANVVTLMAAFGSNAVSTTGNITAGYFVGDGSLLTSLTGANITGTVANATYATSAGSAATATDATHATIADTANAVAGGNVSGQVANALVAGTVYTAAQPNITSVGTLSSLSVTGNVTGGNIISGTFEAVNSAGGTLKNSSGTTQAAWGAGGGDNFAINVSTNLNGNNAQIDISPTGTGHVHIKPTGTGAVEIAPTSTGTINNMIIGNATPAAATVTTLSTTGNITAAGILTDGYYYANGTPFSGGGGSTYGDSNVNTLLSAWGSNTLSTTGTLTGGNITGGNILTGGIVSAVGNITAPYFIGNGSALTSIAAGGSNTQLQYNNGGALAGNSLMTFDQVTGNISLGNLVISNAPNALSIVNSQTTSVATSPITGRTILGTPLGGSISPTTIDLNNIIKGSKYGFTDNVVYGTQGAVYNAIGVLPYVTLTANITNASSQIQSFRAQMAIGGGAGANTISTTSSVAGPVGGIISLTVGGGGQGYSAVGNTSVSHARGGGSSLSINAGSNVGNALIYTVASTFNASNGANTLIGMPMNFSGTGNVRSGGNLFGVYMANNTATYGFSSSNTMRATTNYYFLRNDDDVAQNKIGSLRSYSEFLYYGATSGTIAVDKNDGQSQYFEVSGSLTISGFNNFSTAPSNSVNFIYQRDTVTLIFRQPATGQTITLPTGAAYKYASGSSTMGTTANAVQTVTVQGIYNATTFANEYLITISPEFV